MPTSTYTPIATITLASNASSVTFTSISQAYKDLIVIGSGKSVSGGSLPYAFYFNSDFGSNYINTYMYGTGSAALSGTETLPYAQAMRLATTQSNGVAYIMDYSATDKHKNVLTRGDTTADYTVANVCRWANTSAITTILVQNANAGNQMAAGTTLSIYGIAS